MNGKETLSTPRGIVGDLFASIVTLLLFFSGYFVIFTPLPLFYWGGRYGVDKWGRGVFLSGVLASLLYLVLLPYGWDSVKAVFLGKDFLGEDQIVFYQSLGLGRFLYFLWISGWLVLGSSKEKWSFISWGKYFLLSSLVLIFGGGWILGRLLDFSFLNASHLYLNFLIQEIAKIQQSMEVSSLQIDLLLQQKEVIIQFFINTLPAWFLSFTIIVTALNIAVTKNIFKLSPLLKRNKEISQFSFPFGLVWGVIGSGIAFFVDRYIVRTGFIQTIAVNLLIVALTLYLVQGFVIFSFWIRKFGLMSKTIVYLLSLVFFHFVLLGLISIGFADNWVNFRKIRWQRGVAD